MAQEGADVALDGVCGRVEALGSRVVWTAVAIRDLSALEELVGRRIAELGRRELGRLDVVVASAGISTWDGPERCRLIVGRT
ncbi:hypothetical protein [Gordonia polyisoprenivorans]|uniref:hypothetical protein n=1 Tax=Gordonia polyisoprenivorans TaxID=84595 RepID=UPI001AD6B13F|nr:hypothetical protein [Gordonia polyisoprenivorans]QTI71006.1 hypothetical protein J6U32_11060 [Gordonia polyisoprenivorans]